MTSKLNPNAGAWVPSFVSSVDASPPPATAQSPAKPKKATTPCHAVKASPPRAPPAPIPAATAAAPGRISIGSKVKGRLHYTIAELLQFRTLCTALPPDLELGPILSGGAPKPVKATKKEKGAARAPMLHYDPSALSFFKDGAASAAKQPVKPTDNPEKETKDAISAIEAILASPSHDAWLGQIQSVAVTCTPTLQAVVGLLFDRAIAAPSASEPYAALCASLSESLPEFKDGARTVNFRRVLLTKCYEALVEEPSSPHAWRRQCMLGNVVFVGELFRRQLLTENVMHVCVAMMLDSDDQCSDVVPEANVLDAACRLLLLVGDLLDGSSPASRRTMDEYFDALQRLACLSTLPSALRPLLQETLDARSGGWVRKRVDG
ncbi:hypothetical protein SPRG_08600 [Saprolegnia parasitica CBS 223.65]|uniref:MIF4G domain-containing protein n=1 Tax=Saprolegnia parasitica (strain CBS 223.65) TaxID=695850 RepID=A0A067CHB5_SAPPC|nr:hypothetical protein SPRG_08600 [Saprolegnia parasitica CBS 223.65]KDO25946.1 hypothetical protein SPRG_08600 [Saprolegnia parasitica CBS 223.65]|eukprot:XP_012203234.1 hypothetical protein SPRG_08600 [Saprolegnia parasitica CBS 223.65]